MLSVFANAFRTPDLRKKLLFVLGMIAIYRFGAVILPQGLITVQCSNALR